MAPHPKSTLWIQDCFFFSLLSFIFGPCATAFSHWEVMPDYKSEVKFTQLSQSEDWETFLPISSTSSNGSTADGHRDRGHIRSYAYVLFGFVALVFTSATSFCIGRQWIPGSVKIGEKIS